VEEIKQASGVLHWLETG